MQQGRHAVEGGEAPRLHSCPASTWTNRAPLADDACIECAAGYGSSFALRRLAEDPSRFSDPPLAAAANPSAERAPQPRPRASSRPGDLLLGTSPAIR